MQLSFFSQSDHSKNRIEKEEEEENVDYHIILKPLKELLLIQAKTR